MFAVSISEDCISETDDGWMHILFDLDFHYLKPLVGLSLISLFSQI